MLPEAIAPGRRGVVRLADLADVPWVLYPPQYGLSDVVMSACAAAGFTPETAATTAQVETAARLAAAGLGPALVPVGALPPGLSRTARPIEPAVVRPIVAYTRGPLHAGRGRAARRARGRLSRVLVGPLRSRR